MQQMSKLLQRGQSLNLFSSGKDHRRNEDVSLFVGFLIGLIPSTEGIPFIGILTISILFLLKNIGRFYFSFEISTFQYIVFALLITAVHAGHLFPMEISIYYAALLITTPFILFFATEFDFSKTKFSYGLLLGLSSTLALLIFDFFSNMNGLECRAYAFQVQPLRAAVQLVALSSVCFVLFYRIRGFDFLIFGLIIALILVVGAIMGARSAFLAIFLQLFAFAIFFLWRKEFINLSKLIFAALIGVFLTFGLDSVTKCDFSTRMVASLRLAEYVFALDSQKTITTAESSSPTAGGEQNSETGVDSQVSGQIPDEKGLSIVLDPNQVSTFGDGSQTARSQLLLGAVESIREHPWFGEGAHKEQSIVNRYNTIERVLPNAHSQYVSWLIWGGVFGLISGLVFLLSPIFLWQDRLVAVAFVLPWAVSLVTLSGFALGGTLGEFVLTNTILFGLMTSKSRSPFVLFGLSRPKGDGV